MNVKWIICAVAAIGVLIAGGLIIWQSKRTKRKRQIMQRECAGSRDSILVYVPSFGQTEETALTIANVFETAACPLRVYVAVYEVFTDTNSKTVADAYAVECKASVFCLKDHIRVLRVPAQEQKGILVAMDQLERHLLRAETFVCTLLPGTRLCAKWDELCISSWRSAGNEHAVLTAVLPTRAHADKLGASVPGTYSAWNHDLSLIAVRMKKQPLNAMTVPAIAWSSSFSFGPSAVARALPYAWVSVSDPEASGWCSWTHDMLQSARFVSHGWQLLHPRFAVGTMVASANTKPKRGSSKWKRQMFAKSLSMLTPDLSRKLGWRLHENGFQINVTARGQLGLLDANNTEEVDVKLGSMGEVYSLQARLELPTK